MTAPGSHVESLPSLDGMEIPGERFVERAASVVLAVLLACIGGGLAAAWFVRIDASQDITGTARFADANTVVLTAPVRPSALAEVSLSDTAEVTFVTRAGMMGPRIPALVTSIAGPCREATAAPFRAAPRGDSPSECRVAAILLGDSVRVDRSAVSPIAIHMAVRLKRDRAIRVLARRVFSRMPAER